MKISVTRKSDLHYLRHQNGQVRHCNNRHPTRKILFGRFLDHPNTSPQAIWYLRMICNIKDQSEKNFHVSKFKDNLNLEAGVQGGCVGRQNPFQEQGLKDAAVRIVTNITDGRAQHTLVFWHISVTAYHLVAPVSSSMQRLKSWEAEHILLPFFVSSTQFLWLSILWGLHPGKLASQEKWDVHLDLMRTGSPSPSRQK